jgi:hypothetical protein
MRIIDLKPVSNYKVQEWLDSHIKELTPYQKEWIINEEIVRFAPFYFMERTKKTNNVLLRLTIIFMLPVLLLLIIGLPFNFFITGSWGYSHDKMKWYSNWVSSCGL